MQLNQSLFEHNMVQQPQPPPKFTLSTSAIQAHWRGRPRLRSPSRPKLTTTTQAPR
jgi:hypothetical protein